MLIGKRINGRYKLLEMIGGGGMSNVYLAHDMILDRDVAIKVLRYNFSNEEELLRRFQREALSATSLTHPNIVNIYDVGEDGDIHYIVMEYVKGETLKQYIQRNAPISPSKSVAIMRQLTSAIAAAHANHIIHRDIKPQNILVNEQGDIKITDFGIAMALSATSHTQTNSVLGTVHYLSPEQARGGTATRQSDIYALGIVLFELLTGQVPFSGESAVSIALKHLQAETPSVRAMVPTIPQSLENVVLKATAKDPRHRYRSAEEMERDLSTSLSPERANEAKFVVETDEGATKVLPIIKEPVSFEEVAETKKMDPVNAPETAPSSAAKQPKKKKKKWKIIVGVIAGLLLLVLLLFLLFPGLFKPSKIEIPEVEGMTLEDAIATIEEAGFQAGEEILEFSDEIEKDLVIRTSPGAGKEREKNTVIDIYISQGKQTSAIGDYRGRDIEQVMTLLQNQNLRSIADPIEEFSDQPKGTIIKQDPEPGTEIVPEETDLVFTISKGPDLRTVKDLTGFNEKALDDYAQSSGFKISVKDKVNSNSVPAGNVIEQSPKANTKVPPGSTIEVVLSSGPQEKHTKTFVKSVTIPYHSNSDGEEDGEDGNEQEPPVKQIVRIYIEDKDRSMAEPVEEFELTETTTRRLSLKVVEGEKAAYRIMINNETIEEQTIAYEDIKY